MGNTVAARLKTLLGEIPPGERLVAVSKFHPAEAILEAYAAGQRLFGESRVQELLEKMPALPADIDWHFIGHLQTNKVRQIVGKVALIESVDSERLLRKIDEESRKVAVTTDVLLQLHVAEEETKFGFSPDELNVFVKSDCLKDCPNVRVRGLMAMATNTDEEKRVRADFRRAAAVFSEIKSEMGPFLPHFDILSMGMSGDWPLAVEEGANLIRVGSAIFGNRNY